MASPPSALYVGSPDTYLTAPRQASSREGSSRLALEHDAISGPSIAPARTRPTLGSRATSSPLLVRRRPQGDLATQESTIGLRNSARGRRRDHDWTLFSQLMENEGQLRSPDVTSNRSYRNRDSRLVATTPGASQRPDMSSSFTESDSRASVEEQEVFPSSPTAESDFAQSEQRGLYPPAPLTEDEDDGYSSSTTSSSDDHNGSETSFSVHSGLSTPTIATYRASSGRDDDVLHPLLSGPPQTRASPTFGVCAYPTRLLRKLYNALPSFSPLQKNILKCSLAYFLASLFTFSPYLSGLMSDLTTYGRPSQTSLFTGRRPSPSGHMVATIAVYFNPAKTRGAMLQADFFCLGGLLYATAVCGISMGFFWILDSWRRDKDQTQTPDVGAWEAWSVDAVDLAVVLWIGVTMSAVAWMKVWMANPSFNTACSMIAIIIFVVLVKEGGLHTLFQVSTIVLLGAVISNIVCHLVWPQTATVRLRENVIRSLDSFRVVLGMLVGVFLLDPEAGAGHGKSGYEKVKRAVDGHQASFTSLKGSLAEATGEWVFRNDEIRREPVPNSSSLDAITEEHTPANVGTSFGRTAANALSFFKRRSTLERAPVKSGRRAYEDAVDSLNRLAQHLNGLRSGTRLQYELSRAGMLRGRGDVGQTPGAANEGAEQSEDAATLRAAAVMFGDLVDDLGPPLKALSTSCTTSLTRLREAFVLCSEPGGSASLSRKQKGKHRRNSNAFEAEEFIQLVENIELALTRFESTSNHAVLRLYRRSDIAASVSSFGRRDSMRSGTEADASSVRGATDNALMTGDGESVFLVYFFIFTLQEFARELVALVDAMGRVYEYEQARVNRPAWWKRFGSWLWQQATWVIWRTKREIAVARGPRKRRGIRKRLSAYLQSTKKISPASFPKVRPHAPNTIQTPPRTALSFTGRVGQMIWATGKRLGERDMKYAIKVGMATAMLAAPAFFDGTRALFVEYWGDWALVSFFVVISPTIGATNWLSLQRVLGTLFGAAVAAGIYTLFPDNGVVLSIFGFFFSLPCFHYGLKQPQYLSASRFVLLTYNLTCLYCFNLRQVDVSVWDVAFHRALAVTAGVVWAAVISRFWWPAEARRELSERLGEFCLNLGWLYTRLVASNSFAPEFKAEGEDDSDEEPGHSGRASPAISKQVHTRLHNSIQEFMAMELHLQIQLIELQGLLAQTQHEPRLKGPFPVQLYRGILTSLQTILDKLHSMRCVTTREEWYTTVRHDFIIPVNKERHEMVGNIILSFSTLASAFRLKAPLPPYLPPAEKARQRLVEAIRKLDVVRNRDVKGSRQLLFFAYALTMKGVTQELEALGKTLQEAFGVIGQTPEEFEALFMSPEDGRKAINLMA